MRIAEGRKSCAPFIALFAMSGRDGVKMGSMPSGLKRFQAAESLHFVTFSCFHRLPLLEAPGARETVEAVLELTGARHQARVYAYVLMPEHVHLLVNEPPRILLAQFLKALKQITSRKLRGSREKFWQGRYYDSNVREEKARFEVIRYIHRNPVKRGLVAEPEDWLWSSLRHYASGVKSRTAALLVSVWSFPIDV